MVGGRRVAVTVFVGIVDIGGIDDVTIKGVVVNGRIVTADGGDKNENQSCPEINAVNIVAMIVRQTNTRPKADNSKVNR